MSAAKFSKGWEFGTTIDLDDQGHSPHAGQVVNGTPTVSTTWAHTGAGGYGGSRSLHLAENDQYELDATWGASTAAAEQVAFAMRLDAGVFAVTLYAGASPNVGVTWDCADGKVRVYRGDGAGTLIVTSTATFTVGTAVWVVLEVTATETGQVVVYHDGVAIVDTGAGIDCRATTTDHFDSVLLDAGTGCDVYVDDYVQAAAGVLTVATPLYAVAKTPNSDDASCQSTPSTGSNRYALLDEDPPSATDYVSFADTGQRDLYGASALPAPPATVFGARVAMYAANDSGDSVIDAFIFRQKTSATTLNSSRTWPVTGTYDDLHDYWPQDATTADWSPATIEANLWGEETAQIEGGNNSDAYVAWYGVEALTDLGELIGNGEEADEPPYRAVILPDPRFIVDNIWSAHSTYAEQDAVPDIPVDESTTPSRLQLHASGTIAASDDINVIVSDPGFPGDELSVQYNNGGNTFSWDPPIAITGLRWMNATTHTTTRQAHNHVISLQSGTLLAAVRASGTGWTGSTSLYCAGVTRMNGTTGVWTYIDEVGTAQTGAEMKSPCLLQLPSGRILLFDWVVDTTVTNANISVWASDDDGDTWAQYATNILGDGVSGFTITEYARIRAAYSNGQILLLAAPYNTSAANEYLIQAASSDLGCTFEVVHSETPSGTAHAWQDILPGRSGGFWVYSLLLSTGAAVGWFLPSAWDSIGTASSAASLTLPDPSDQLTVWQGEGGVAWLAGRVTATGNVFTMVCWDGGKTWYENGSATASAGGSGTVDAGIWRGGEATISFTRFSIADSRGRAHMLSQTTGSTLAGTLEDYGTVEALLGGHTDVSMPRSPVSAYGKQNDGLAWAVTWTAIAAPGEFSTVPIWTAVDSGAPSAGFTAAGLWEIDTTGGFNSRYYECTSTTYIDVIDITHRMYAFLLEAEVVNTGVASAAQDDACLRVRLADGTNDYEFRLRLTETSYAVYDVGAAGNVAAPVTGLTSGERRQYLIWLNGSTGAMKVYHRSQSLVRDWTQGVTGTLTNDTGSPDATPYVHFGNATTIGIDSTWNIVAWTSWPTKWGFTPGSSTGSARPLSSVPMTLPPGVKIWATGGPGVKADTFNILPKYGHPVSAMFPQSAPSPREQFWTDWTSSTKLALKFHASADVYLESTSIGVSVRGTNWHGLTLEGYTGGWETIIGPVVAGWQNIGYTRSGNTVVLATTADGAPWIPYESLVGGTIILDGSSPDWSPAANTILHHNEGRLSAETGRSVVLTLDPDTLTGSEPASGKAWIIPPSWTLLVHDVAGPYQGYRLTPFWASASTPPANTTAKVGAVVFGPVVAFGRQYSSTRSIEVDPNTEVTTRRSGTRSTKNLGPNRRRVSVTWTEGVDTSQLALATETSPDTIVATTWVNSVAIAAVADTPFLVRGILDRTLGPDLPLVYLPRVPVETGAAGAPVARMLSGHEVSGLYCRLTSSAGTEVVVGDEAESEVLRIRELVFEEEV